MKYAIESKKQEILNALKEDDTVIINTETSSGKTTQVPQYFYDAGYKCIVVEPRPIEAYSAFKRVTEERKLPENQMEIGCRAGKHFMNVNTFGILYTSGNYVLSMFNKMKPEEMKDIVLIIDEVHEWKLPQEILMGWVNAYREKGNQLKMVLMSATLDPSELVKFYKEHSTVKLIQSDERNYEVDEFFFYSENFIYDKIHALTEDNKSVLVFCSGKETINRRMEMISDYHYVDTDKVELLPLHGQLTFEEQQLCFTNNGKVKVIFATNIAQSGITPPVHAIIDDGLEKKIVVKNGVDMLVESKISVADCIQRKYRAGRLGDGVYYLQDGYAERDETPVPEIQRMNLDKTILKLLSMNIDPMEMKFVHDLNDNSVVDSMILLDDLGIIDNDKSLTEDGKLINKMPVGVRYGRMLLEAKKRGCVKDVIKAVAIMQCGSLLVLKHLKTHHNTYTDICGSERCNRSDILAEIEIYDKICRKEYDDYKKYGISSRKFNIIRNTVKNISYALKNLGFNVDDQTKDDKDIIYSIFMGLKDSVSVSRYDYDMSDGKYIWNLSYPSEIQYHMNNFGSKYDDYKFVFGLQKVFTSSNPNRGNKRLLMFASIISLGELRKYDNGKYLKETSEVSYDGRDFYIEHCIQYRNVIVRPNTDVIDREDDPRFNDYMQNYKHLVDKWEEEHRVQIKFTMANSTIEKKEEGYNTLADALKGIQL